MEKSGKYFNFWSKNCAFNSRFFLGDAKSTVVTKPTPQPVMNIENLTPAESTSLTVQTDDNQILSTPNSTNSPVFIRYF